MTGGWLRHYTILFIRSLGLVLGGGHLEYALLHGRRRSSLFANKINPLGYALTCLTRTTHPLVLFSFSLSQESERSIVKGGVPIGHGDYSLRQMTVIFKRAPPSSSTKPTSVGEVAKTVSADEHNSKTEEGEDGAAAVEMTAMTKEAAAAAARVAGRDAVEAATKKSPKLPEIILFWGRSMRSGGNLVVCPDTSSMNRIIQAYLVCEVVQDSKLFDKSS